MNDEMKVTVTDIKMPFTSMVVFMIKWAIASIPAAIILFIIFFMLTGVFSGLFRSIPQTIKF